MSTTTTGNDTLTLERSKQSKFASVRPSDNQKRPSAEDFAKTLASAYLKFTQPGSQLEETDSPQSFVSLYELHNDLTEQAHDYLESDVPFVYEGQPIQPLLLNFGAFRIMQASRKYLLGSFQEREQTEIDRLKQEIKLLQQEYDAILQLA